jgi:hypothetical protein
MTDIFSDFIQSIPNIIPDTKDNPMEPSMSDEIMHNLSLCIDVEISSTLFFIEKELEYSDLLGYATQAHILSTFLPKYKNLIADPFQEHIYTPIMDQMDNPDLIDYSLGYIKFDFFKRAYSANRVLRKHFADSYTVRLINNGIDDSFPGIMHNPDLFPHIELIQFLRNFGTKG